MTIKVGDRLPEATFVTMSDDGPAKISTADYFSGKKVALFAVPGAFTPTCNNNHLPGFLEKLSSFAAKGVDKVACVSVNDVHVMNAWAKASGGKGKIDFLADGSAEFARALGLELDASGFGMGIRSKRYSMLVEDGAVKILNVEEAPGKAEASGADALLAQL